jgi:hypothetical protein
MEGKMEETSSTQDSTNSLRRLARLWSAAVIIATLFVGFQNLREPLQYIPDDMAKTTLVTLTLLLSVFGLALAWRWELLGGSVNLFFFLLSVILYWLVNGEFLHLSSLALMSLLIVPGILFLVSAQRDNLRKT